MVNSPSTWEAGEEGTITFEVKNHGENSAKDIRLRLAGNLVVRLWIELGKPLNPGARIEVDAQITPSGPGNLVIEPQFSDGHEQTWAAMRHFPLGDVKPSSTKLELSDVGALLLDHKMLAGKIKIRGDVGVIKIKSDSQQISKCQHCGEDIVTSSRFCDHCGAEL